MHHAVRDEIQHLYEHNASMFKLKSTYKTWVVSKFGDCGIVQLQF